MDRAGHLNARENSHWLALMGSLLVVVSTLSLTLVWPGGSEAADGSGANAAVALPGDYQSPHRCRECHTEQFQEWSGTTHADAAFDPLFQVYLERSERPGECLYCHTTGYDSTTGRFVLAGVTCEACHGPYLEGHSAQSMVIAAPEKLCGTCHTSTLAEWTSSHHGAAGVTCTACHEVHTQRAHAADQTNALCVGCHQDQLLDPTHTVHLESGLRCTQCHLAPPERGASDAVNGQLVTGHTFAVIPDTCQVCHPDSPLPTAATPLPR
jgi:predicted CXXCH cytochrome family protein